MNYLFNPGPAETITASKANGKNIYIKGKKLLDLSYAAGSLLLGHTSKVYKKSLNDLEKIGSNYSYSNVFTENYSLILKKIFSEYSKFIMCTSGTEANMKALRISRAISKKKKIVMVSGSWHGSVDELLYISKDKRCNKKKKLSNGLSNSKNTILIPYNNFLESKKILQKNKKQIALVIIEPIQQSIPLYESENYVKKLHNFCKKNKIMICFDEMVTGMRLPEFSVYKKLKVVPDIITFGKIFGGGAPIGVLGITSKVERKLIKRDNQVFFGGTYSLNPLSSFLGSNTIKYILKNQKKIYSKIENLSHNLTDQLNEFISIKNLDIKIVRYSSIIRIIYSKKNLRNRFDRDIEEKKKINQIIKFKNYIYKKKIFMSKYGAIFLSFENSITDINYIAKIFKSGFEKFFK